MKTSHKTLNGRWTKPPTGETLRLIDEAAGSATERVLASLAIPIGRRHSFDPRTQQWRDPVSILGFVSDDMAGSVIVSAPWPLMGSLCPTRTDDTEDLVDWSRELSNLLAGAFKSALLPYGVTLQIGLPTSVVSLSMRIDLGSPEPIGHRYGLGEQELLVVFDVRLSASCVFDMAETLQPVTDLLLF